LQLAGRGPGPQQSVRVGRARRAALGVGAHYATAASGDLDPATWGYRQNNARTWFRALKEHAFIIVWDNFEVVQGIAGTAVEPTISEPDRWLLFSFLQRLRGGCSKVLITSRSEEEWLGVERVKISLNGLQGEERREYCERILGDLGITIAREDYCPRRQEFDKARGSPSLGTRWLIDFNTKASKSLRIYGADGDHCHQDVIERLYSSNSPNKFFACS
jgi:hypothetical protein